MWIRADMVDLLLVAAVQRSNPFPQPRSFCHFQRLGPHKTGPKKKVPAGVHTEDPCVTEHCVVLHNPQPHNPHPVKLGVGYGEAWAAHVNCHATSLKGLAVSKL